MRRVVRVETRRGQGDTGNTGPQGEPGAQGPVGPIAGPMLVVVDASGEVIGVPAGNLGSPSRVVVNLPSEDEGVLALLDEQMIVGLARVFFSDLDCAGAAYVNAGAGSEYIRFLSGVPNAYFINEEFSDTSSVPYLSYINDTRTDYGLCQNTEVGRVLDEAIPVSPVTVNYQAPFRIVQRQ